MNKTESVSAYSDSSDNAHAIAVAARLESIRKTSALQSAILDSSGFSIIATDDSGIIQFFNVGAACMFGYTADEVVNKISPCDFQDLDELLSRAEALSLEYATPIKPGVDALTFKASRDIDDVYELTCICKDGSRLPICLSVTVLNDERGEIIGYLLIGTSNAAKKRVVAELTSAKIAAEKASLAKSDFLVQLSHELRTPLNVILGFAQLIESGVPPPPPSQKQNLNEILVAGRYLLDLLNGVFDLALIGSGKAALSSEPAPLAEVMRRCQSLIEPHAKKRRITIAFPSLDAQCYVNADQTRLKQVLMNLLLNAVRYSKPGGSVTVGCATGQRGADSIRISVRDTGSGMAPEKILQLFQPFNGRGRGSGDESGVGMGLVVSKQLVELMGGTIDVESVVGEGSLFWIDLNTVPEPQTAAIAIRRVVPERRPLPDGTPSRTVLYVEDNLANLKLVEQIIARREDLRLLTATNGASGIESARTNRPDVILMDINMPGMSGIEAMKILRVDPSTAHIPIIALSANAMPHDIEKGLEAGFFNYITKPMNVVSFLAALDAALDFAKIASDVSSDKVC